MNGNIFVGKYTKSTAFLAIFVPNIIAIMTTTLTITDQKGLITAFDGDTAVGDLMFKLRDDGRIVITHTLTFEGNEGRGEGRLLVQAAVDYARPHTLTVIPLCSFARHYMEMRPELHYLIAD